MLQAWTVQAQIKSIITATFQGPHISFLKTRCESQYSVAFLLGFISSRGEAYCGSTPCSTIHPHSLTPAPYVISELLKESRCSLFFSTQSLKHNICSQSVRACVCSRACTCVCVCKPRPPLPLFLWWPKVVVVW